MKKISNTLAASAPAIAMGAPIPAAVAAKPRADASNPAVLLAQLNSAFEEFKATNEANLKAKVDDVVVTEKMEKINSSLSDLEAALNAQAESVAALSLTAGGSGVGDLKSTSPEYVSAFKEFMRADGKISPEVMAAVEITDDAKGGYLAPVEWDRTITDKLKTRSPIRENAQTITISGQGFKRLYNDRVLSSGWVGEKVARPETTTPGFTELSFDVGEMYANPSITQTALDDAAIDLESWLAGEVNFEFARQENIAFLSGDGVNKPFGLLTYVAGAANAAKHPFGAIPVDTTGDGGIGTKLAALGSSDKLYDTIYGLDSERSADAKFYMNRKTLGVYRQMKGGDGNYLWQPSYQLGQPSNLAGVPVVDVSGMPEIGADAIIGLYGDMRETYLIINCVGIRLLRDPYTNKPFVMFYTTKRVGGGVQNPEFMRAIKVGA